MALEKRRGKLWFFEDLYYNTAYGFEVSRVVVPEKRTKFQKILLLDTPRFGKVFVLDGIVQFTEEDESIYHEMMAHWPLFSHPNPKNVLIVGGGDGGVLRELVKHKEIRKIFLVEIDRAVAQTCKKFLPKISNGAFDDPRVRVFYCDAAKFIQKTHEKFDVIIMDTTDPIGPSKTLFGADFIQNAHRALNNGGILIRQAGSMLLQPYELRGSWRQIEVVFGEKNIKTLQMSCATYFGGPFSLVAALKGNYDFDKYISGAAEKFARAKILTSWFSGRIHRSCQALSPALKIMLDKERYGEEIAIDLQNLTAPTIPNLKKWSIESCRAIEMIAFGTPMLSGKNISQGASFVQYIETSAINYRQFKKIGAANIFTCASLPTTKAIEFSMNFFGVKNSVCWYLPRGSFDAIDEIHKETKVFDCKIEKNKTLRIDQTFSPRLITAELAFSKKFPLPIHDGASAFELIMDLYDCDYTALASCNLVKKWAKDFCKIIGVRAIGKTDAPDFGHAKKKTAGPSVVQFFDKGSNISHYSSNWLAMLVNIVSRQEFDLNKAISYTIKFFKAGKAMCWILPRGLKGDANSIARKTTIFEVNKNDII